MRGKSIEQIEKLLSGPADTTVQVTFVESNGIVSTEQMTRFARQKQGVLKGDHSRYLFRNLQDENSVQWSTRNGERGDYYETQNLDLFVRAEKNFEIQRLLSLPDPKSNAIFLKAGEALITSDTIGDTAASEQLLNLVMKHHKDFSSSAPQFSRNYQLKLIRHLINTGRTREAEILCRSWIDRTNEDLASNPRNRRHNDLDLWDATKLQTEILLGTDFDYSLTGSVGSGVVDSASTNNLAVKHLLLKMLEMNANFSTNEFGRGSEIEWLGNAFQKAGDDKNALECFKLLKPFDSPVLQGKSSITLDEFGEIAYRGFRLGQLLEKTGAHDEAIAALQKILNLYDLKISPADRDNAEKEPSFFPAPSDIKVELSKVQGGKIQGKQDSEKQSAPKPSDAEKFALFNTTYSAIQRNDKSTSKAGIEKLLEVYNGENASYDHHRKPLNLFCALQGIARELTAHKRFDEANHVLEILSKAANGKELTPVATEYIHVDRAINETLQAKIASAWKTVDEENSLVPKATSFRRRGQPELPTDQLQVLRTQENMHRFAALYSAADYPLQAELLIDRALKICNENSVITSNKSNLEFAESKIMLLLDAAVIRAKKEKFVEAQRFALQAIELCNDEVIADDTHNGREFRGGKIYKTIQLAQILITANRRAEALKILRALDTKLNPLTRTEVMTQTEPRHRSDGYVNLRQNSIVHAYIAKLLLASGEITEAKKQIATAIDEGGNSVPFQYYLLGTEIAERAGNNASCAHYYSEAEKAGHYSSAMALANIQPEFKDRYLRKAIEFGEKAPNLDRSELANIYVRLAAQLDAKNVPAQSKEILALYEKARVLIPDNEPRKVDLLNKISMKKRDIATTAVEKMPPSQTVKETSKTKFGVVSLPPDEQEGKKNEKRAAIAKTQILDSEQAAQLAEKLNRPDAIQLWMRLADIESQAGNSDAAVEHARHGISLFRVEGDGLLKFQSPIGANSVVISTLKKLTSKAEALLKEATEKVSTVCGKNSPAYAFQLSQYFSFLVQERRDEEALKVLDQIMAIGMRQIEICSYSGASALRSLTTTCAALPQDDRGALALTILNKILAAQKVTFSEDDLRVYSTLVEIAKINEALNQNVQAEQNLNDALAIKKLYLGEARATAELAPTFIPILRKLKKTDKLAMVEDLSKNQYKVKPDLVDPQFFGGNKRVGGLYRKWETTPDISAMKSEYDEARKQAPYSPRCTSILERLIQVGTEQKDWALVSQVVHDRIEIYKRTPDGYAGRQIGCVPPVFSRIGLYHLAVDSNLKLGNKAEAANWLQRAKVELPEPSRHEILQLAEFEQDLGSHEQAVKYISDVEKSIGNEIWLYQRVSDAWRKLGNKERASEVKRKGDEAQQEHNRKFDEQRKNPLNVLQ